jgi:heptose I phosphotransferase
LRRLAGGKLRRGPHWIPTWAIAEEVPRLPDDFQHPRAQLSSNGIYVDDCAEALLHVAGIKCLDDAFNLPAGVEMRKPGLEPHRDRLCLQASDGNGSTKTLYVKRYGRPPIGQQLRRICSVGPFQGSAYAERYFIKRLSLIGVPTMRCLAFGQDMAGPWERRSFSVTAGLDGVSLEQLVTVAAADATRVPPWCERREIIRQLALVVRRLHGNGLFHRDLYLSHVFLTRNADGRIVLRVIDLARMIEKPLRPRRWRIKDLAALDHSATAPMVTRADRLRFMKIYCGMDVPRDRLRRDMAAVRARAARIARHDARRAERFAASGKGLAPGVST